MTEETMTIREMCDSFGVTPRTLRFYEAKELLFPIREGQKRLFTNRDRARLKLIMRGKRFGFSLEDIRQGKMVIVTDDEDRENEGDLCMAAELCTPETINFMASKARGLICLSLQQTLCQMIKSH